MPLENALPRIDDRNYDSLLAEVRTRIARYTPEWTPVWTDVNDNDPGIALAQVFAWLTEMLAYRMNLVPELNYIKFLQLIGIELHAAEPAGAEVTFPVQSGFAEPYVIVPQRTQLTAEAPDGGPPITFETDRALIAVRARLAAVLAYDGYAYTSVTADNQEAVQGFQPFGPIANDNSALLFGFDDPGPFPAVELNLAIVIRPDNSAPVAFQCGLPDGPGFASATLKWEFWNGSAWQRLSLLKDETRAFTRSGHVFLKTPNKSLQPVVIAPESRPLYWIRARVERSQYERPPTLLTIRTNTIAAHQAETVRDEVLGGSTGRRDQVFRLANAPVLRDTLRLEIDEGSGPEIWTGVDDFFGSGPADLHYMLNRTTGEIRFGDGRNGNIPIANPANPEGNIVAREYRFGGGRQGNVGAGAINTLTTSIDGIDANAVANLLAADSGRNEETLDEAKKRAPHAIRSRYRAVTAEDFELLAMEASSIKRAKALPLYHPDFPGVRVPGVVTIIVVPDGDGPSPTPSEGTLRAVCAYLDQRRLLTTELYVVKPTYQRVQIRADIVASDDADLGEVQQQIEQSLLEYFHPLRGGEDGLGWPFGGTIYYSRVNQRCFTIAGVASVTSLVIVLDGEEIPPCTDVTIKEAGLLFATEHEIDVSYRFES